MLEIRRYTAVTADETRTVVLMLGTNRTVISQNTGPSYSAIEDPRKIRGAWAVVTRGAAVMPGVVMSFVTLTGQPGDTWMLQLHTCTQGSDVLAQLPAGEYQLKYNIGVLLGLGSLLAGDLVQIGALYD